MFPLQGGKIKQKIPLENKDKLDKTFENFKRLALAYEQYVNKAIEKVKDIEDLQYLKISNVENFESIFDNWDKFEEGMPASIKDVFRNTVSIRIDGNTQTVSYEDFKRMTRDIPLNVTDYPVNTLEKILNNSNIKLDKVSTRVRKTKGQQFQDMIRTNTVSEIVKDIVSETSQQKVHQEYFDKLIKEDAEQFYSIKSTGETLGDPTDRKNVLACYEYIIKYKKACIEGIRKTLDTYEGKLKDFLIKLAQKSRDEENYKKISTIMQSFVNYKNDPSAFLQIMVNMGQNDILQTKMETKINTSGLRPDDHHVYSLNLEVITEQQLAKVFKLATQGIVDYINLDQGLLQQFSKQMKAIIPTDFTEIILDVFINYIMVCAIKFNNNRTIKFDLGVLNTDYNVFSSESGFGIMSRAKNVLTALKNTNADARAAIFGNNIAVNNTGGVINGADVNDNTGVITLNNVNITGARVNNEGRAVNNTGGVINGADVNDNTGVITLNNVNITGARVMINEDGQVLQRLIDDININESAKTILGLDGDIRQHITSGQLVARLTDNNLLNNIINNLPELERVLHKSSSKNRTEYILYRMIDNMVKSIYGTIILIIQAHSKENQNIYTLLGSSRRRLQGGVQVGTPCKTDCFSAYVLMYRLHNLFVYQATKIFFRKDYTYTADVGQNHYLYGDLIANAEPSPEEAKQIYSIIQITRTSKFYDLYKCLIRSTDGMGDNFDEYFRCINALWEQVPGSITGILSERTHNLLTQYVQELINNMIITLQTLNNSNVVDKVGVQDTFNRIESKSIDGINTFDRITNTEEYDTRIVIEERDKIKQDDVLELYMAINYQIQKFTEVYIQQHKDDYFQLQIYKDAVLQELQRYKNIWLAKTEDQKKLYATNVDENKFKKQYLIHIINDQGLFQSIKTGFDQYGEDFGLQYKQLKFIQLRIMDLMYSYHKQYVEKYNNITTNENGIIGGADIAAGANIPDNFKNFNTYFLEAVKYLYSTTHDYVYKIFLGYNGINPANINRDQEHNLSYRATQFIQNSEFVKMKIYMFFLEQLEAKIAGCVQIANDDQLTSFTNVNTIIEQQGVNNMQTSANICKILMKLGVIEKYNPDEHKNAAYDKHQMPFMICFSTQVDQNTFDPPSADMVSSERLVGNRAHLYMIITKNFYNYFQQNNTYLKNFCVNSLGEYTNSIEMLKCIPMLEIRDGEIDASKVYAFLTEAKNAILAIYDKTNSIYTKQEIKDVIRHQLDLSLDIVPVLKDAFEKFVLPVQSYYNTFRYNLSRLDHGWFSTQEYRLHVYGLKDLEYQPLGHVKSLINKTTTNAEGVEEVSTTYKNCRILSGKIEFKRTKAQVDMDKQDDYELDIVKKLNEKIAEVHDILFKGYHTIPQEFRDKVLSNDVIRQYSELTDVKSGNVVFQLPLASVQMPFHTEITSLDLSIKDQQTVIDSMLNMNEVDKYTLNDEITYLTSAMMQFMQITYTQNSVTSYSQIPRPVKIQYINLFRKLFNKEQITDADLPQNFVWQNLFKRAIDGNDMLANDVLTVATYGAINNGARPQVGNLDNNTLQRVFGKDNRTQWAVWINADNNQAAQLFVNAINTLCRNQLKLIEALAFGVGGVNRVEANNADNKAIRRAGLDTLIKQFTKFNLVNFLIGMTYYRKNVSSQIKKGLENLYVPENANWDNLRMVKAYNHQQVSYIKFDNSQGAYNALTSNIDLQSLHHPKTDADRQNGGENEHYDFKFKSYAEYIQYLTNRIQQNAGRNTIQQGQNVNGGQIGQAAVEAQEAVFDQQGNQVQPRVQAVGANDQLGINDDRYTQIDVENNDKPFAPFTNQYLYRAFLVDLMKTVVLEFDVNDQLIPDDDNRTNKKIFNNLVSSQDPIIVPMAIPSKEYMDKQTILQSAYAKGFIDSVSKIINDYHDNQELSVIYDQKTQKIELFDQSTYSVEQTELPILYMSNILALQDDQEEINNLSEERKIEITYDLIERIRNLQDALITVQDLQTPAVSIYNTYIAACQAIVNNFMQKFEWNKFFDKNFDKKYFNLEHFLELDKVLRQRTTLLTQQNQLGIQNEPTANSIDVVKYKPVILAKFLKLILIKGINTLKSYDGKQLHGQVFKNFNFYIDMIASGKYNDRVGNQYIILNTQFMRLTFVKRLTSQYRIIGKDHYWVTEQIQILKDQTRFIPTNPEGDNEYYQPDWQTVLQGQRNYRNKVAQKMLSYNGEYINMLYNDLHVFDIRRIPYMQQYTSQPYVYNVIVDSTAAANRLQYQQAPVVVQGQGRGGLRYLRGGAIDLNTVVAAMNQLKQQGQMPPTADQIKQAIEQVANVIVDIIVNWSTDTTVQELRSFINGGDVNVPTIDELKQKAVRGVGDTNIIKRQANVVRYLRNAIVHLLSNQQLQNDITNDDNFTAKNYVDDMIDQLNDVVELHHNYQQLQVNQNVFNDSLNLIQQSTIQAQQDIAQDQIQQARNERDAARNDLNIARNNLQQQVQAMLQQILDQVQQERTARDNLLRVQRELEEARVDQADLRQIQLQLQQSEERYDTLLEERNDLLRVQRELQQQAQLDQNRIQQIQNQLVQTRNDLNVARNNNLYQRQNRINRGEIHNDFAVYAVIPQHLMDEMSMNTGLTNISTVNVSVQLTFDISKISNTLDTYLGNLRRYEHNDANAVNVIADQNANTTGRQGYLTHYIEQFYTLRKQLSNTLVNQAALRNVVISLFNNFLTDPVIFTYNIATHQNKQLSRLINEFQQNNIAGNMKLFSILDLQPFHPIQLIKDNSIYQIMTVFGIYVNKYNSLFTQTNLLLANNDNNTYKQLNYTTKYGQKIYVKYYQKTVVEADPNNRQIHNNRKPMILHEDRNTIVYYIQQNGQDVIIRVEYGDDSRIETHDQLQHLLNRHDMSRYGINVQAWNEQIIDSNLILGARIINADNGDNNNNNIPDDANALTVIKQFNNNNHVMYQLVKYNGIVLADNNRANADLNIQDNTNIPHLVMQIFDFIRHYNKLIQTNDATDKQGITYSQYHVMVTDENAANQIAYDSV